MMNLRAGRGGLFALTAALTASAAGRADVALPPWVDDGEVSPPTWARSVSPKAAEGGRAGDMELFTGPSRASGKRGVTAAGASLPFFGEKRGPRLFVTVVARRAARLDVLR